MLRGEGTAQQLLGLMGLMEVLPLASCPRVLSCSSCWVDHHPIVQRDQPGS